ncbi:MAG: AEC family transporter [Emergencia sp.]|uniref:AEC family transporter n=1 Tax=Anaerotruncus colihominis TaxID=169435 RepID=A0A845QKV0_9FIRM|nr:MULTISPECIES: AEC family transporter [Anaerotruncus]MCI9476173.1 AEC family transporter [Emergencia sp.]NBH62246.1 AEC family transporter [Anaerotruncus colihominis]NCF02901.1 AEC family transporter [Anaerotruncus sp. 80]
MANLLFCLNATIPLFLLLVLGMVFTKFKIFDEVFVAKLNSFVFQIALPVLVFYDLCREDFYSLWDGRFVLFCFIATALSIALTAAIAFLLPDKSTRGEFIQAAYRSSAAILGIALIQNLYGSSGMAPLMIIGSVPLYNIMAVVVLSFFQPAHGTLDKKRLASAGIGILKNPILWGVLLGLFWALLNLPMPQILDRTLENIGRLATPLGLLSMGAAFDIKKALKSAKSAGLAAFIKLIGLGLIFVPIAVFMGFTGNKLVSILIMCCSSTTVSSYIMAKNMDHEGTLTSSTIMLTTFFLAFTLTGWLFVLKTLGLL